MKLTRRETLTLAAAAALASLGGWTSAYAKDGDQIDLLKLMAVKGIPDKALGNADAKVTLIEYASPTCPHCAFFANSVLPDLKTKYIDTGKVKYIMRPFMRNVLDGAIFLLAETAARATDGGTSPAAAPASSSEAPSSEASSAASSAPDASSAVSSAAPSSSAPAVPEAPLSAAAIETYHSVIATFFKTQGDWGVSDKPRDAILGIAKQLGFTEESFDAALTNQDLFKAMEAERDQALNDFGLEGTPTFYINGKQLTGEKTLEELSAAIDPLLG